MSDVLRWTRGGVGRHSGRVSEPERTPDGRYIVVNGRRWRASDPGIPPKLRQELVDELMAARRLVRTDAEHARPRVQEAKIALGERGYEWWTTPSDDERDVRIEATIRALLRHRAGKSICPSDVARVVGSGAHTDIHGGCISQASGHETATQVGGESTTTGGSDVTNGDDGWRDLMPAVRAVAHRMRAAGEVLVTQKGKAVDETARGPVRIIFADGGADDDIRGDAGERPTS